ncbi:MAG: hypothetical protein QOG54_1547 [Actinomycetota bacterium]|nr:hypothetical protein [Actinomycetota bacterium]
MRTRCQAEPRKALYQLSYRNSDQEELRSKRYVPAVKRAIGATLGAVAGLAFSTLGLIDTSAGLHIASDGGNDATPVIIVVGVAIGALLGLTVLWRFPIAILGAIVGLAAGMWLRDNASTGSVQPPWVFLLLFGLPAVGAGAGYLLHLPRATWARHAAEGAAFAGFAGATVAYVATFFIWATATHDPRCDPIPQPDGSVLVRLCPNTGTPVWIGVVAALLGVVVGLFTRAKLNSTSTPLSGGVPEIS